MSDSCPHEARLTTLERRHDTVLESFKKMEDKFDAKLDMILYQINKVSVLEEKHSYQSAALERAFSRIQTLDEAIDKLSSFRDHAEGMAKMAWILWSAMGLSLAAVIAKLY